MLTVGSLFSGIGGLDLGLERAGMEVIWQSEIDPYGCRVLKKHWPEVPNHGNIKDIKWGHIVRPDIICGGYPCQPFSTAGKRQGTDDPRHLWPWVREAISHLRPDYAILENVRGHVSLGLSTVLGELASIGYNAEWQIVSAASVGAPHRRDRVIIVAYPNSGRQQECQSETEQTPGPSFGGEQCTDTIGQLANTNGVGRVHGSSQIFTTDRWLNALSLIGSGSTNVANTNNTGSGTPRSGTDRNGTQEIQRRDNEPQSGFSRRSETMANSDGSDTPNGRQRQSIQSQDSGWGNDRSGSGSDIGKISMGSSRKNPRNVADTTQQSSNGEPDNARNSARSETFSQSGDSGGTQNVANADGTSRQLEQERTVCEPNIGRRSWWAVEPDVGRVAHGVPSRVDRLRGLGNAVVPQVAELIGRMVIDYDTDK